MANQTKEQEYIDNLERRVGILYLRTRRNVPYKGRGEEGEIDLLGKRESGYDVYEVKSTGHPRAFKRAINQLKRVLSSRYDIRDRYVYTGREDKLYRYENGELVEDDRL